MVRLRSNYRMEIGQPWKRGRSGPSFHHGKQIRRVRFHSIREQEQAIHTFLNLHNAQTKPFIWTKAQTIS